MRRIPALPLGLLLLAGIAEPSTVRFTTPPNNAIVGGQTVSGALEITTANGSVTVALANTLSDPTSVSQNISGVFFRLNGGADTGAVTDSQGTERWVRDNGTYYDNPMVANLGWALQSYTMGGVRGFLLCVVCPVNGVPEPAAIPRHTQLGDPNTENVYANANGSIKTNAGHEPFLAGTSTFTLAIANVTQNMVATRANFFFGTAFGPQIGGEYETLAAPEPAVLLMLGSGLWVLGVLRRRSRRLPAEAPSGETR